MTNENLLSQIDQYNNLFINEKKSLNASNNTITAYQHILNSFYEFIAEQDDVNELNDITKEIILSFINKNSSSANSTKILRLAVVKSYFTFIDEKENLKGLFELSHLCHQILTLPKIKLYQSSFNNINP